MGQSLVQNYIHIVFSTKYRQALIKAPYESELYTYIGGTCKALECPVLMVGGYQDHVHILCMLSRKIPLMTLVQKIKANSSKWIKSKSPQLENFSWQSGYGGFSVSPEKVDVVVNYIKNQHEHHRKKGFQEEYRALLKEYDIAFDEQYVWD